MSAQEVEVLSTQDFTSLEDYQFSGNTVTVENKRQLVLAYRERGTISHAAESVGVSRKCVHHYINTDEDFARALADAHEDCADNLESSVYERAFKDSILAMFWLKAYRPRFRDRMTVDVDDLREQVREKLVGSQTLQIPPQSEQIEKE